MRRLYLSQLIDHTKLLALATRYQTGIELIDFSIAENLEQLEACLVTHHQKGFGTLPIALHGPFFDLVPASFDPQIRRVTYERFSAAYKAAQALQAQHIVFHTGFLQDIYYYEGWLQNSLSFWREFLEAHTLSVPIYIENVFEDDLDALYELLATIDHPHFNLCLDIGHANLRISRPVTALIEQFAPYLKHLHIHNNHGLKDEHGSLLMGTVDYPAVFKTLKAQALTPGLTLEMADPLALEESLAWLVTQ